MKRDQIVIAVVDDHAMFREGIKALLSAFDNQYVLLDFENGEQLLKTLINRPIDLVLMDLDMPILNGLQTMEKMRQLPTTAKVIFISQNNEPSMIARIMQLGANGYLVKDTDSKTLKTAIISVLESGYYFNDMVTGALLFKMAKSGNIDPKFKSEDLSPREIEVLQLICQEFTSSEIADKMSLSIKTIENHRSNLMSKTGARNLAGLVVYAVKNRLYNVG